MRERAAMSNGNVMLESQVGKGTRILAVWPSQEPVVRTPPLCLV